MASVFILGEDLAGLTLAWHLRKQGFSDFVRLAEPDPSTEAVSWNWSPLLSSDAVDWARLVLGPDSLMPSNGEWGYWKNRFIQVPVEAHLGDLPVEVAREWLLGFIQAQNGSRRRPDRRGSSADDWIRDNFGGGIAEGFWLPYFGKRATVPPRDLVASAASAFIGPANLESVVDGALSRGQAAEPGTRYQVVGGFASLQRALAGMLPAREWSGQAEIDVGRRSIRLASGELIEYSQLVSSLPLTRLGKMVRDAPEDVRSAFNALRSASCVRHRLTLSGPLPEQRVVLFPEPGFRFHRWCIESNPGDGEATLALDVALAPGSSAAAPAGEDLERVLRDAGLLRAECRVTGHNTEHLEHEYAIQDQSHYQAVRLITQFLEDHGVITHGPLGSWNNAGIDTTVATAERVARAVMHSKQHGLALRAPERMPQVSIVIPVYKEEDCLEQYTLQIIEAVDKFQIPYELILAENGGRDRTGEIADRLASRFRQVRAVHFPEPNYGKALAMGILNATGENVVCFEIDFWDAEFVEIVQVLLKKYDAVIGSKRAPGARDRRPFLRRSITASFNLVLKLIYGFQGTDTHGIKAFRREPALPIVRACATGKDIFATELVLRMERAGLYICEMPLEIQELRSPSINLLKRVPSTIRNLITLWRATRKLPRTDFRKMEPAPKVSIAS